MEVNIQIKQKRDLCSLVNMEFKNGQQIRKYLNMSIT